MITTPTYTKLPWGIAEATGRYYMDIPIIKSFPGCSIQGVENTDNQVTIKVYITYKRIMTTINYNPIPCPIDPMLVHQQRNVVIEEQHGTGNLNFFIEKAAWQRLVNQTHALLLGNGLPRMPNVIGNLISEYTDLPIMSWTTTVEAVEAVTAQTDEHPRPPGICARCLV